MSDPNPCPRCGGSGNANALPGGVRVNCGRCGGTGRVPVSAAAVSAAERADAVFDIIDTAIRKGRDIDIAGVVLQAIRDAEAAAEARGYALGAEAMRAALAAQFRAVADQYEKDGVPGELGYNCWGWRGIAKTFRDEAAAIAALPVPAADPFSNQ